MRTILAIYESGKGYIIQRQEGDVIEPQGVPFIWVEVPDDKELTRIDVSSEPHQPVFENIPKSKPQLLMERMEEIVNAQLSQEGATQSRLSDIEIAIAGLYGMEVV